jgi:EAL domain-containing protein (putative c-di-GMP-specific phosphodiesterase class I)
MALLHKDGSVRHVEGHGIPILDAHGELIGWSGSMKDKTEEVEDFLELGRRTQEVLAVVEGEALEILFQPIVDLRSGDVIGVEALSRIRTEPYRPPNVWFAAAHAVELGAELELLAVRMALSRMDDLPPSAFLAINVSPGLLPHAALEGLLFSNDLSRIVIEVTEHEDLDEDQYARIKEAIAELRSFGIRVAVDDAGAGFSSLRHVLELQPDIVKLDVSITAAIEHDPARRALASCLAQFAKETSIEVVAEGIETIGDARTILAAGIKFGQGYGLAMPGTLPVPSRVTAHLVEMAAP